MLSDKIMALIRGNTNLFTVFTSVGVQKVLLE